jgi:hypothetical protein
LLARLGSCNVSNNLISIKNIYHRKSDLFKSSFKNSERISGYLEAFLKRRLDEDDFFKEFACFWHKFPQIPSKYPDIPSKI